MSVSRFSRRQMIQAGAASLGVATLGPLMAQPSAATTAALAALTGPERLKRLAEGAKKEGVVSIYTSMPQDDMAALTSAFEAKYGVKAKVWRSGSEKILQRGLLEAKANRFEVDVFETNSPEMEVLSREKVLIAANSPFLSELIPQAIPSHKEWIATRLNIFTCAYNTKLVRKEDLPKTYQDLLDPKWKGKICTRSGQHPYNTALIAAYIARHFTGAVGRELQAPLPTVTTVDHHSLVAAFLCKYYGTGNGQPVTAPLDTVTTRDRFALATVQIDGEPYRITDIGMRMLTPRELARAQGFPDSYQLSGSKADQIAAIGNAVVPQVMAALTRANLGAA